MKKLLLVMTQLILFSCSNPLGGNISQVDTKYDGTPKIPGATVGEVVPGSIQNVITTTGRKISATAGAPNQDLIKTTTAGRKAYLSVQAEILPE